MKKITISLIALTLACPSFADIGKNEQNPTCNDTTIGATSGTTSLQANWAANTINLDWDPKNGGAHGSSTCSYDGGITLQATPSAPAGYAFAGWQVRAAAPQQTSFDLSTLSEYLSTDRIKGTGRGWYNGDVCSETVPKEANVFSDSDISCDTISDLALNEWKAEYSFGTLRGIARCSKVGSGEPTDDWQQKGAKYCWCQPTGFDAEGDGIYLPVSSSSWILANQYYNQILCAKDCAVECATSALNTSQYYRTAFFGVSQ